jgi:hypothetical protein
MMGNCFSQSTDEPRIKYNFNPGWKLLIGDPQGAEKPEFDDTGCGGGILRKIMINAGT